MLNPVTPEELLLLLEAETIQRILPVLLNRIPEKYTVESPKAVIGERVAIWAY